MSEKTKLQIKAAEPYPIEALLDDLADMIDQCPKNVFGNADALTLARAMSAILAERERALEEAAGVADAIEKASRDEAMDLASKEKWQTANHWNAHADGCLEVSSAIRALKGTP